MDSRVESLKTIHNDLGAQSLYIIIATSRHNIAPTAAVSDGSQPHRTKNKELQE